MQRLLVADFFRVPELALTVTRETSQAEMALHVHEFAELVVVHSGTGYHVTAQGRYPISAGDVFFIPPEQPHGYAATRALGLCNVLLLPARLGPVPAELTALPGHQALFEWEPRYRDTQGFAGHLRLPSDELARIAMLLCELREESARYTPGGTTLVEAMFRELQVRLARGYGTHASPEARRLLAVQRAAQHIETNLTKPVSLITLARVARMSSTTFKRAFKSVTGSTPIDYVLQARLARACDLLRDSESNITEIALSAGFSDSNYFARQFRRRMGCTPREWRKRATTSDVVTAD